MTDQERYNKAIEQSMALGRALENLSGILKSIGPDDIFEVVACHVLAVAAVDGKDEGITASDLHNIYNRLKLYIDGADILHMLFSGLVLVEWSEKDKDIVLSITSKGRQAAEEILLHIGVV